MAKGPGEWSELELVDEDWYDGPLHRVAVGKYEHEGELRLEISLTADPRMVEGGMASARFTLAEVESWLKAMKTRPCPRCSTPSNIKGTPEGQLYLVCPKCEGGNTSKVQVQFHTTKGPYR